MTRMRVTVIGCAGSFPGPNSPASCYLFEADGFRLVVDMGNGALGVLQRHAAIGGINAVLLSHLHADHCVDLYAYCIARRYAPDGPMPPIPVYAPSGALRRVAKIHGFDDDDGLAGQFEFSALRPGRFPIGPFTVEAGHVNHPVEAFGFRLTAGGASVAYSGDTGNSEELVRLAADADLALFEASFLTAQVGRPPNVHLTAREAAEHAARAGARHLVLTHLVPWNDPAASREEAAAAYDGKLTVASTGLAFDLRLSRPAPSSLAAAPGTPDRVGLMTRPDGRAADALRTVRFTRGWLDHAEGSVLVEFGATRVLCAASVAEEVPRWRRGSGLGWLTAEYAMLPRATNTRNDRESVKGRLGGRTQEISRLIGRSLRACVDYKALGENTITIDCDVLQADGGTRTAAITGGYVALRDAITWLGERRKLKGSPLVASVSAVSVGIVDGEPRLDLCYEEDSVAETDMNVVCTGTGDFVEVQGTAEGQPFSRSALGSLLDLAVAGCAELSALQEQSIAG